MSFNSHRMVKAPPVAIGPLDGMALGFTFTEMLPARSNHLKCLARIMAQSGSDCQGKAHPNWSGAPNIHALVKHL